MFFFIYAPTIRKEAEDDDDYGISSCWSKKNFGTKIMPVWKAIRGSVDSLLSVQDIAFGRSFGLWFLRHWQTAPSSLAGPRGDRLKIYSRR